MPGLRLLWGRCVHLGVQQRHAWGWLNCTLLYWALFPIEVLLDKASLEVAVK